MPRLTLVCLHCRHRTPIQFGQAGQVFRCPQCGKKIRVPAHCLAETSRPAARSTQPAENLHTAAPLTMTHRKRRQGGQVLRCPECGKDFRISIVDLAATARPAVHSGQSPNSAQATLSPGGMPADRPEVRQRPTRSKRTGPRPVAFLAAAAVGLLVGAAAGLYRAWTASGPPEPVPILTHSQEEIAPAPPPPPESARLRLPAPEIAELVEPDAEGLPPPLTETSPKPSSDKPATEPGRAGPAPKAEKLPAPEAAKLPAPAKEQPPEPDPGDREQPRRKGSKDN